MVRVNAGNVDTRTEPRVMAIPTHGGTAATTVALRRTASAVTRNRESSWRQERFGAVPSQYTEFVEQGP
jgi:hypothetical protein